MFYLFALSVSLFVFVFGRFFFSMSLCLFICLEGITNEKIGIQLICSH